MLFRSDIIPIHGLTGASFPSPRGGLSGFDLGQRGYPIPLRQPPRSNSELCDIRSYADDGPDAAIKRRLGKPRASCALGYTSRTAPSRGVYHDDRLALESPLTPEEPFDARPLPREPPRAVYGRTAADQHSFTYFHGAEERIRQGRSVLWTARLWETMSNQ